MRDLSHNGTVKACCKSVQKYIQRGGALEREYQNILQQFSAEGKNPAKYPNLKLICNAFVNKAMTMLYYYPPDYFSNNDIKNIQLNFFESMCNKFGISVNPPEDNPAQRPLTVRWIDGVPFIER